MVKYEPGKIPNLGNFHEIPIYILDPLRILDENLKTWKCENEDVKTPEQGRVIFERLTSDNVSIMTLYDLYLLKSIHWNWICKQF